MKVFYIKKDTCRLITREVLDLRNGYNLIGRTIMDNEHRRTKIINYSDLILICSRELIVYFMYRSLRSLQSN